MQFRSIRTKFLASLLPVMLIGFLAFFGISYKMASNMLIDNADTIGKGVGKQAALEVQRLFETNVVHLEILAEDNAILHGTCCPAGGAVSDRGVLECGIP